VNKNGCEYDTTESVIIDSAENNKVQEAGQLKIYPDPVTDNSVVEFTLTKPATVTLKATDALGRNYILIKDAKLNSGKYQFPADVPVDKGLLYYSLTLDGSQTQTLQTVKL
jgi:hypothetical protein